MKVRWNPRQQQFPKLTGKVVVDTFRGQIRIRNWPRKVGPSKLPKQQRQVEWFKQAIRLAKRVAPTQQALAIAMTKGTGLYPRDLLLMQMSGGIYDIFEADGRHILPRSFFRETRVFQGAILELEAPFALPAGASTPVIFPLPVLDTLGFWSLLAPTRLTIPEGINVVELSGGFLPVAFATTIQTVAHILKNGATLTRDAVRYVGLPSETTHRGPLHVVAGDFFELSIFTTSALSLAGAQTTFFSLNVLDAD